MAAASIKDILAASGIENQVGNYQLLRQDDGGNEYVMCGNLSEEAAAYLTNYYEGLNHHQGYGYRPQNGPANEILPPVPRNY